MPSHTTWFETTILVSSADIKSLFSSPKDLILAPGANKFINVIKYLFDYKFGTIPYADGGRTFLSLDGQTGFDGIDSFSKEAILANSESSVICSRGDVSATRAIAVNKKLVLRCNDADFTAGDGTVALTLWYELLDVAP